MKGTKRLGLVGESGVVRLGDGFVPRPDGARLRLGDTVDSAHRDALQLADRLVLGKRTLGRFSHSPATVGVACDRLEAPALLLVSFIVDATTEAWWRERVAGLGRRGRARVDGDPVGPPLEGDPAGPGTHLESRRSRLVEVREASGAVGYAWATAPAIRGTQLSYGFAAIPVVPADTGPGMLALSVTDVEPVPGMRRVLPARRSVVGMVLEEIALTPSVDGADVGAGVLDPGRAELDGLLTTGAAGHRAGPGARRLFEGCLILRRDVAGSYPEVALTCRRGDDQLGDAAGYLADGVRVAPLGGGRAEPTAVLAADGPTFRLRIDDAGADATRVDHVFVALPDTDLEGLPLVWHVTSIICQPQTR